MDIGNKTESTCQSQSDFWSTKIWQLTSSTFLAELAGFWTIPDLSAPQTVYLCFEVLLRYEGGVLHDLDGKPIDFDAEYQDGMDIFEWAWGVDWGRSMRRIQERAERPFPNRMKSTPKLLTRILLLHYAREIRQAQMSADEAEQKTAAE